MTAVVHQQQQQQSVHILLSFSCMRKSDVPLRTFLRFLSPMQHLSTVTSIAAAAFHFCQSRAHTAANAIALGYHQQLSTLGQMTARASLVQLYPSLACSLGHASHSIIRNFPDFHPDSSCSSSRKHAVPETSLCGCRREPARLCADDPPEDPFIHGLLHQPECCTARNIQKPQMLPCNKLD